MFSCLSPARTNTRWPIREDYYVGRNARSWLVAQFTVACVYITIIAKINKTPSSCHCRNCQASFLCDLSNMRTFLRRTPAVRSLLADAGRQDSGGESGPRWSSVPQAGQGQESQARWQRVDALHLHLSVTWSVRSTHGEYGAAATERQRKAQSRARGLRPPARRTTWNMDTYHYIQHRGERLSGGENGETTTQWEIK